MGDGEEQVMTPKNPASLGFEFRRALSSPGLAIIAEIKRRSPSRGDLNPGVDAAELAQRYRDGGATCLSVLTDAERFGGSPEDLQNARTAAGIPVLRKDFLSTLEDVRDSADMGADAMLLILPDLPGPAKKQQQQVRAMHDLALELGVDVLTEVRDEAEFEQAVDAGAYMIAINQRDDPKDARFTVDYKKAERVAARLFHQLPDGILKVAASGMSVTNGTPLTTIAEAGYDAALIGEALVTAKNPTELLQEMTASLTTRRRPSRPTQESEISRPLAGVST